MDEPKAQKPTVGWPGVVLIAALASNLFWLHSPLKSARPKEESRFQTAAMGDQMAEARLWQDPFEAVSLHRAKAGTERVAKAAGLDLNGVVEQIRRRSQRGTNLTLLPVMVTGTPYTEGGEWRVRTRYAVLSGLDHAGYVTEDRSHVGFFEVDWPHAGKLRATQAVDALTRGPAGDGLTLRVPFEWLERYDSSSADPDTPHDHVLVLWLEEEKFEDAPLTRLALLLDGLRESTAGDANAASIPVKIIGPYGSTTLRAMAKGGGPEGLVTADGSTRTVSDILRGVTLYSATATAADWRIDPRAEDRTNHTVFHPTNEVRTRIRVALARTAPGLGFVNLTCTDDQLAWQLVNELVRRGVDSINGSHHVALISEWDTFYGRALPKSYTNAVSHLGGSGPANAAGAVWRYSYLRGLDGKLAGREESPKEKSPSAEGGKTGGGTLDLAQAERPEGNSQLDYVPRLAERLKAQERESRRRLTDFGERRDRSGCVEAIGVLGSDVYDKLLLLQSLRERFPEAIFFTTDLDARLAHPSQAKWARNMIVASSFGLELHPQWQRSIPPFRDSYQTAQFLAALVAMGVYTNDVAQALAPRLFEIGRSGPYDLSVVKDPSRLHPPRLNEYAGARPSGNREAPQAFLRRELRLGLVLAGLTLLLLVQLSPGVRAALCWPGPKDVAGRLLPMLMATAFVVLPGVDGIEWRLGLAGAVVAAWSAVGAAEMKEYRWNGVAGTVVVFVALILLCLFLRRMLHEHLSPEGEPFSLFAGVSLWPSELIRLVAFGLGVGLLAKAVVDLRKDTDLLVEDFGLEAPITFLAGERTRNLQPRSGRETGSKEGLFRRLFGPVDRWLWRIQRICIFGWRDEEMMAPGSTGMVKPVLGAGVWRRYNLLGRQSYCCLRFLPAALTYLLVGGLLVVALGLPFCPYRGPASRWLDQMALILSVAGFVGLTFYVMDATRLCTRFIDILSSGPTEWPPNTLARFQAKRGLDAAALDEWIDVQFIANRTKSVGRMIYYPFLVLFLIIVARNRFFDAWTWPLSLMVLLGANATYALFTAVHLRRHAEQARRRSLGRLNEKLSRELGAIEDGKTNTHRAEQLRLLVREIETNQEGAFAPLSHQPVVGAVLMPFGGAGVLALLEFLATAH